MITQENIPYTADELKAMVKTCEKYNKTLDIAKKIYNSEFKPDEAVVLSKYLLMLFPELKKDNNDERIRKELITHFRNTRCVTEKGAEKMVEWIAWLEKQKKPEDIGEISDGYHTFNELYQYRMLYNAAFFNLLPKEIVYKSKRHHDGKECFGGGWFIVMANLPTGQISNHYELKDWDLFQIPEKEIADEWDGHTPQEAAERLHKYLLEKQAEPSPYSGTSFKYNGNIYGMCIRDGGLDILYNNTLSHHIDFTSQDKFDEKDKVEPKFNEGDFIVPDNITSLEIWKVINIDDDGYYNIQPITNIINTEDDETYPVPGFIIEKDYRLWTIEDAKDGDVLVDEDNNIGLYSGEKNDLDWQSCIYLGCDGYLRGAMGYHKRKNTKPATKEQRDLLFSKMKQEGYEWDDENKKLSKQTLQITPKFCIGQLITDDNGTWYKIKNIKCLEYYELYDACEDTTHLELCSIIDEKFRENRFVGEIKKMMGD